MVIRSRVQTGRAVVVLGPVGRLCLFGLFILPADDPDAEPGHQYRGDGQSKHLPRQQPHILRWPEQDDNHPDGQYEPGRDQESFDKQFVRNYLEGINFDKSGPGVVLPDDIVEKTSEKYIEGYERLTGKKFTV